MTYIAPISSASVLIREDDTQNRKQIDLNDKKNENNNDDLIFGALDDDNNSKQNKLDEISPSTGEGICLHCSENIRTKKRDCTSASISTTDNGWENILPIIEVDGSFTSINHLQSINGKLSTERTVGMSNFRAKHRLRHHSQANTLSRWKDAVKKAVQLRDPWLDFETDQYPEEIVIRHEFDPFKRTWHTNEITIKMESKPFAHGSMRECFRLKKLSIFSTYQDWNHSSNYIAKRYKDNVLTARYFDDVMMQMTTKLWATHYNRHNPPKKVDIIQMSVLEFRNRIGQPYYHLERFINGEYIKYNSNSGFVYDDTLRHTPQAFSHFTFEASCHEQIVVDVQGVGDLYTDPQIHTYLGIEYGEGNLGIRGMALFFYTHECNPICSRLKLTPFDLSNVEREQLMRQHASSPSYASNMRAQTECRGSEEPLNSLSRFGALFRRLRSQSSISEDDSEGYVSEASSLTTATAHFLDHSLSQEKFMMTFSEENLALSSSKMKTNGSMISTSVSMTNASPEFNFNIEDIYNAQMPYDYGTNHRSSAVIHEKAQLEKLQEISACYDKCESILGQIHLEICKYYHVGRFSDLGSEKFDEASAFFHLDQSAELSVKEAIFALAKIYLDLPRDLLPNYQPSDQFEQVNEGLHLMIRASELHEVEAYLHLAQLYDKGIDGSLVQNWKQAAVYYEKYIQILETESINIDEDSGMNELNETNSINCGISFHDRHDIVARLATLYKIGGYNLLCDYRKAGDLFTKAAEMATAAMKGRLANKYYIEAEEAYALEPDEESGNS